jgi:hypothetical protein
MDSAIRFEGLGPFHLPTAQSATTVAHTNNGVTAVFRCQLPSWHHNDTVAVDIQMVSTLARELAVRLLEAADEVDRPRL